MYLIRLIPGIIPGIPWWYTTHNMRPQDAQRLVNILEFWRTQTQQTSKMKG